MQVDGSTYGIIPDTFADILTNNYLLPLQNTFPNANSINSPIYALAYVSATQDQVLQAALANLWNAINANTASGLGLDILASTVLNLTRPELVPSTAIVKVQVDQIYSVAQIQMTVSAGSGTVPIGWTATGFSTLLPYQTQSAVTISGSGTYYFDVYSLDTSTPVPANSFTGGDSVGGVTFTATNPASATLGSLTIPSGWSVTSSFFNPSPVYATQTPQIVTMGGTYFLNVYSNNIATAINENQLDTIVDNLDENILSVTNPYPAILGTPPSTDAQFQALRRYYLNVEGQTYFGMEKAIIDLRVPALRSVNIAETISETTNYSVLIIGFTVSSAGATIPVDWTMIGTATPVPPYKTLQPYIFPASTGDSTHYIPTYSTDMVTVVPIGDVTSASPTIGGVTSISNPAPSVFGSTLVPNGLGQRGYTVYLDYPIANPDSVVYMSVQVTAIGGSPPYTIPVNWTVSGVYTPAPSPSYKTIDSYTIETTGTYTIPVYSTDVTTVVPPNTLIFGDAVSGITFGVIMNPDIGTLGGTFDINDPQLQRIAQTCFAFHPLGTQFYPASYGATLFTVPTPYAGYLANVWLNPFQIIQVGVDLELVYNSDPADAGYSGGVFNTNLLPTLQTDLLNLINQYFLSKTLPTDTIYTINELSELIQNGYTGIVALVGNSGDQFSFSTTVSPTETGLLYLRREIGYYFQLSNSNFNFSAINKNDV